MANALMNCDEFVFCEDAVYHTPSCAFCQGFGSHETDCELMRLRAEIRSIRG